MKDSGVDWIGQIPENWEIGKIGQLYSERKEKVDDITYPPLSVTMKGILPQLATAAKSDDHENRKHVCKNDFVINSRSDRRGSCGISELDGSVSLINTVLIPHQNMSNSFYNWLFHSSMFSDEFYKWGHGIVDDLWTTRWQDMKKIQIPLPPHAEQKKIAAFLDDKCAAIDEIITKTEQSIEEYKKLKQAVITKAVTQGIRPNRSMKDSGIDWIGKIPVDCDIRKLKFLCAVRNEKYTTDKGKLDYFALENIVSGCCKYIETENDYDLEGANLCYKGDVVFGKLRPYLAKVFLVDYDRCCSGEFAIFCNFIGDNRYYKYLLISSGFIKTVDISTYGTKMPRANIEFIKNVYIPFVTQEEQKEIADYLDMKCTEIDALIEKKQQSLTELASYKKSLIYEYVTGKKEVD